MKKMSFYTGLFLFLSPLLVTAQKKGTAQNPDNSKWPVLFDNYIQNALLTWKTPGLSVIVVKDSVVVFKKAYGVQDIGNKTPYTTATLSTCASTTKAMTAVCMAMLVDEEKVKWSDVVSDLAKTEPTPPRVNFTIVLVFSFAA